MGFKRIVSQKAFWKSVIFLGLGFLVVYDLVSMLFEYGSLNFSAYFGERTADGKWIRFLIGQLASGFLYGFILSYGQFRSKEKRDSR